MSKPPKIEFERFSFEESRYKRGDYVWYATTLMRAVEEQKLEPFDYPLAAFDMLSRGFRLSNTDDFLWHVKRMLNADYSHPIILDDYGQVADGFHRICHAIIDGKTTIPAYRLKKMPDSDVHEPEENNEAQ